MNKKQKKVASVNEMRISLKNSKNMDGLKISKP